MPMSTDKRLRTVPIIIPNGFKNLLSCLVTLLIFYFTQTSYAFIDDFDRANTPLQTSSDRPDLIGPYWTIGNGTWAIQNNQLVQAGGPAVGTEFILMNALPTLNTGGTNFVLQATMQLNTAADSAYGGLLFNYRNSSNFYALRFSGSGKGQLYYFVDGREGATTWNNVFPPTMNRPYTLTVSSRKAGIFTASIYDTVGCTNVWAVTNQCMSHGNFTNGLSGLYTDGNFGMAYKNFSLTLTPAPPVLDPVVTSNILWRAFSGIPSTLGIINGKSAPVDPNGYPLTITAVTQGANGGVTTDGANVTYAPRNDFSGMDHFSYRVSNGHGGSASGRVMVSVVNDEQPRTPGFRDVRPTGGYSDNSALIPPIQADQAVTMEGLDPDWVKNLIIAELRIETASTDGTFATATNVLDHYAQMGVNGLWIDPIWERGSKGNGYVNFGPNLVEPMLTGTADTNFSAVTSFVSAAHKKNIRVFFDIIVWGTSTNSPLVTQHPEFYTRNPDGSFWQVWGGYGFDWRSARLQQWYAKAAENFILQTGSDGFRVDLAPNTSGYFFQTIRTKLFAHGRKIFIIGECLNDRLGTFDTEERSLLNNEYLLTNNIVDVIQSGTGIGTANGAGQYRYYTANFCNHDDLAPVCDGNRVRFAYGSIFAPFIPLWWIGEEWNNLQTKSGVMYFNTIDWSELNLPENRSFFEDVKRYIWIKRTFPEIFDYFAANHHSANIAKVDSLINHRTNNVQAYARFFAGEAVLVVPNYGVTNGSTAQVIPDYRALGLSSMMSCKITDLMTGKEIASGPVSRLTSFTTEIKANHLGVYLLKGVP